MLAEVFRHPAIKGVVDLWLNWVVDVAPPNLILGGLLTNDELVLRAPTGIRDGVNDQWALVRQNALSAAESVLDKHRSSEIPIDVSLRINAVHG